MVGSKVMNGFYGVGIVKDLSNGRVKVAFSSKTVDFIYPDAFEEKLQAEDPSIQQALLDLIQKNREEAEQQRLEEKEKRRAEEKENMTKARFDPGYNARFLSLQYRYTYQQVERDFGINRSGHGRGINRTADSVVLISTIEERGNSFVYHDKWTDDGDYIYSGDGQHGDQKMNAYNRAIRDAAKDEKKILLFVKLSPEEYYYQGVFELVEYTYEDDKDESGNLRKEYKFRLRKVHP